MFTMQSGHIRGRLGQGGIWDLGFSRPRTYSGQPSAVRQHCPCLKGKWLGRFFACPAC